MRYPTIRDPYGIMAAVLPVLMLVGLVACGGNPQPNVSPEGAAAIKGRAVVKTADSVLTSVDAAMTSGKLPTAVGLPVVKAIRQLGVEGGHLADALSVLDQAKTAAQAADAKQQAQAVLQTMQSLLNSAVNPIQDPTSKAAVNDLLKNLVDAISQVQALVAGG